jgi:hypothetical protein
MSAIAETTPETTGAFAGMKYLPQSSNKVSRAEKITVTNKNNIGAVLLNDFIKIYPPNLLCYSYDYSSVYSSKS